MIAQQAAAVKRWEAAFVMEKRLVGKLTNKDSEEIDLELETLYTVLVTMGGHVPAERMAEFATALLSTQRGRLLLDEQHKQENREELFALFGKWLQQKRDPGIPIESEEKGLGLRKARPRKHLKLISDNDIFEAKQRLENQGQRVTCEAIAKLLPLNPDTEEPYHRITVNKRLLEMEKDGIEVYRKV